MSLHVFPVSVNKQSHADLEAHTFTIIMFQFLSPSQKCADILCQLAGAGCSSYNKPYSAIIHLPAMSDCLISFSDFKQHSQTL